VRLRSAEGVLVPALFSYAAQEFGAEFFDDAWDEFFLARRDALLHPKPEIVPVGEIKGVFSAPWHVLAAPWKVATIVIEASAEPAQSSGVRRLRETAAWGMLRHPPWRIQENL
jgi:hypothetical protein